MTTHDAHPRRATRSAATSMAEDVRRTLGDRPQRWLSSKWFYDDLGSALFDAITRLPEYYPTRRERAILDAHAGDIARESGADTLIELGSGASDKTRRLLDAFVATGQLARFCPLDVSAEPLAATCTAIGSAYPGVEVVGVEGDFVHDLHRIPSGGRRLVAFLGSTIGNLTSDQQHDFLVRVASALAPGDSFLLGTDLVKDVDRLVAAYDDTVGVTAAFNRNVLAVLNRDLGADFDLRSWDHEARWNAGLERIEMHLVAGAAQAVHIPSAGIDIKVEEGESIQTEISAKFRIEGVETLLHDAGFTVGSCWTDPDRDFALTLAHLPG